MAVAAVLSSFVFVIAVVVYGYYNIVGPMSSGKSCENVTGVTAAPSWRRWKWGRWLMPAVRGGCLPPPAAWADQKVDTSRKRSWFHSSTQWEWKRGYCSMKCSMVSLTVQHQRQWGSRHKWCTWARVWCGLGEGMWEPHLERRTSSSSMVTGRSDCGTDSGRWCGECHWACLSRSDRRGR